MVFGWVGVQKRIRSIAPMIENRDASQFLLAVWGIRVGGFGAC